MKRVDADDDPDEYWYECDNCAGSGYVGALECPACDGMGKIEGDEDDEG